MYMNLETAILKSKSKSDLRLLLDLARKIGIDARLLTPSEAEETGADFSIGRKYTTTFRDSDTLTISHTPRDRHPFGYLRIQPAP